MNIIFICWTRCKQHLCRRMSIVLERVSIWTQKTFKKKKKKNTRHRYICRKLTVFNFNPFHGSENVQNYPVTWLTRFPKNKKKRNLYYLCIRVLGVFYLSSTGDRWIFTRYFNTSDSRIYRSSSLAAVVTYNTETSRNIYNLNFLCTCAV